MTSLQHPSSLLHPEWISLINDTASQSEAGGQLPPQVLELVYQQGWFKMLVPAVYGGKQRALRQVVAMEEALSWANGSLGWVTTLCSGAGWFGGFLQPEIARSIFAKREVCLAGSGASTGFAIESESGYLINGSWKYASGAIHATAMTANCRLMKDGRPKLDEAGNPIIKTFIFEKPEVSILRNWTSVGLKATGSHSFEVKELEVPAERCFELDTLHPIIDGALYKYPFLQLAEATLAANSSGMALRFLNLAEDIISQRLSNNTMSREQKFVLEHTFTSAVERMESIRSSFYEALEKSWNENTEAGPSAEELNRVSQLSRELAQTSRLSVDQLYPFCGIAAADPRTTINRVWRDIHTASQHSLLTFLTS